MVIQRKTQSTVDSRVGSLVSQLLLSATLTHIAHLKTDSYAAHMALGGFYDGISGLADDVAEQYQGHSGKKLEYSAPSGAALNSTEECITYLKSIRSEVTSVQGMLDSDCSNVINVLDEVKSLIDSTVYKLTFLK